MVISGFIGDMIGGENSRSGGNKTAKRYKVGKKVEVSLPPIIGWQEETTSPSAIISSAMTDEKRRRALAASMLDEKRQKEAHRSALLCSPPSSKAVDDY